MEKLLQRAFLKENGNYIYEWNAIDQLVYLMIQSAYLYVTGHLQIRHLADLYVFYRKTAAENQLQDLEDRLKEFKVNYTGAEASAFKLYVVWNTGRMCQHGDKGRRITGI